tara:strand:+ start:814 stop:1137 length:324 start_codon:yes stop_codon:yes gene_type:complete
MGNKDHWSQKFWRPAMAWSYLAICLFDFMIAPILSGIFSIITDKPMVAWVPLTLQNGGLYHIAMGAVTGVTAWSRGKEKITLMQTSDGSTIQSTVNSLEVTSSRDKT